MVKIKKNIKKIILGTFIISCAFNPVIARAGTVYQTGATITGYTGSNKTASGKYPKIGDVAVHCKEPIRYQGDKRALDPIIPFGTQITILNGQTIPTPQGARSIFWVADTGDTNHARYNSGQVSWGWLDVYVGSNTSQNINFANENLGSITRDYKWTER